MEIKPYPLCGNIQIIISELYKDIEKEPVIIPNERHNEKD